MDEEKKEPIKKLKMKKNWRTTVVSPTGYQLSEVYCRRCVQYKNPKEFKNSHDLILDKNGMMSVCRTCCEEIYQDNLRAERDIEKALLKTCRTLNWVFHTPSIEPTIERLKQLREKNPDSPSSFTQIYWSIIAGTNNMKHTEIPVLTFSEPVVSDFIPKEMVEEDVSGELIKFWGVGFSKEDYVYLDEQYAQIKKDYKVDLFAEVTLAKEIAFKLLEIQKIRLNGSGGSTDSQIKDLQKLFSTLAIAPNQNSSANSGKALDTYGKWIQDIEQYEPAQMYDEGLFKKYTDYGNFQYFKDFFIRSLTNLVTNSRNFSIGEKDYSLDDEVEEVLKDEEEQINT